MPQDYGDKPHNLSWNQMKPGKDDGTGCQKTRETIPEPYPEPGYDDGTEQKIRETSPGTLPPTRK